MCPTKCVHVHVRDHVVDSKLRGDQDVAGEIGSGSGSVLVVE